MKTKKQTGKKVLSVFLAVLMIMTAWVFVAPEKAEAATAGNYYVKIVVDFETYCNNVSSHTLKVRYKKDNGKGTEADKSIDLGKDRFDTKNEQNDNLTLWEGEIEGFPIGIDHYAKVGWKAGGVTFRFQHYRIYVGSSSSNCNNLIFSTDSGTGYTWNAGAFGGGNQEGTNTYTIANDKYPVASSVASNPAANTISVPAEGTASKSFDATFKDQYGVLMVGSGSTATFNYELKGLSATMSNSSATVSATKEAIDSLIANGLYNAGKGTVTLTIANNGVKASCTVTLEAPKYTVEWNNYDGKNLKTDSQYYMTTPTYNGSTPTKPKDLDGVYTFTGWSPAVGNITGDTTYTAQYSTTAHTWPAEPKKENNIPATCTTEGSYEYAYYCTACDYELNRTYHVNTKLAHTFTEEIVDDRYKISDATCNASAKYYKSCKDCGASSESNSYTFEYGDFDFTKHVIEPVAEVPASCSSEGIKAHWVCSVCNTQFLDAAGNTEATEADLILGMLDHTEKKIPAIAPSCYSEGYTEGTECSVCGAIVKVPEQIPTLPHVDNDNDHICDNGCYEELSAHIDANFDHKCDNGCSVEDFGDHVDYDNDHICDYGCQDRIGDHVDNNKDHECDYGCEVAIGDHVDADKNHKCDYGCSVEDFGDHVDEDYDHNCDYGCKDKIGVHEDKDPVDHVCDYGCSEPIGECKDDNKDHYCDHGCGKEFGVCEDANKDHKCDYGCDKVYGDHADSATDGDHVCDYGCGEVLEDCSDVEGDGNHNCDICNKADVTAHVEGEAVEEGRVEPTCTEDGKYDSVVYCTECDAELSRTKDIVIPAIKHNWQETTYSWSEDGSACTATRICSNDEEHIETAEATISSIVIKEPACGVRGVTEYTATFEAAWATTQVIELDDIDAACPDTNKDHWCDDHPNDPDHYVGTHEDKNPIDHKCDYGCSEAIGECVDNDKDHYCDHGCGVYYGVCEDADKDHKCDYGCDKFYGTHADKENDGNHECEYCGELMGECTPGEEKIENKTDSTCDAEGKYDSVYYCTECGKEVSRVKKTIEKLPHDWNETVYSWDADAKTFTATRTCKNFASHVETETKAAVEEILVAPKCETLDSPTGSAKYTSAFTVDWATEQIKEIVLSALPHKDDNKDHKCDSGCNITFGVCEDTDKDHKCDYGCDKFYGKHEDLTGAENRPDHFCDYCNQRISDCVDENFDHNCDFDCGASYGTCEDKNHDHKCDYGVNCPVVFGECKDENKDHKCDYGEGCKVVFGAHKWNGHSDIDEIKSKATCMSPAIYYNYCSYCNKPVDDATHEYGEADTVNGHKFDGRVTATENDNHSVKCTVSGCSESKLVDCRYETTKEVLATCQTNGYKVEKCLICRDSKKTNTEKNPANHVGGTEIKDAVDATCIANGYSGDTYCLGCKAKIAEGKEVTADPAVHAHVNMMDYDKVDSTCEKEGYEAYRYCDACNTYAVEKVVIAKKDHQYTNYVSNGDGTHSAQCETCSAVQNTIACSGGVANCVDKKVCDFCKAPYGETDSTNHKKTITVAKKDATCQVEGNNPYLKCEACNTALEEIITIEKKAHVYGEWTKVAGEDKHVKSCLTCNADIADVATVEEDCEGGYAYCNKLAKCSVCKGEYGSFDYSHHRSEITTLVDAKAATCCEKGYTGDEYYICCYDESKTAAENAGALKKSGTEIPVAEHNFTIEIVSERVPANCKETGNATYKCSTCPEGKEATKVKTLEIDLSNHKSSTTITVGEVEATCIEDGFTGNVYYDCCYDSTKTDAENKIALKTKGTVVKANGEHNYGGIYPEYSVEKIEETKDADGNVTSREIVLKTDAVSYDDMVAARDADGFWYHVKVCTVCYEVSRERCYTYTSDKATCTTTEKCVVCEGLCSLMDSSNHAAAELVEGKSATCTENGVKDYYKCTACGKRFFDASCTKEITAENEDELIIVANGTHTIDRKNQKPTANNNGTHTYKCSACGTEEITESCSGGTATCSTLKKCQYCGVSYGEYNDKVHEKGTIEIGRVEPDRCKPGVKGKVQYECCGKVTSGGEEIPAPENHTWTETTSKTDNCASGYTITRTCDVCKTVETEEVAAGTHKLSVIVYESEKDCTTTRYIYYACSICSHTEHEVVINGTTYKYISVEEIPAKDDCSWSAWTTVKASCIAEGSKSRHCLVCGKTENIVLPKTAHSVVVEGGYGATCDTAGKQDYAYCAVTGCPYAKGGQPIGTVPGYEKYANSNGQVIGALGHGDHNGDDYCDHCGRFESTNVDGTNCNCVCHKQNGFMKLIYKFLQFFWKLFKINKTCCSAGVHY